MFPRSSAVRTRNVTSDAHVKSSRACIMFFYGFFRKHTCARLALINHAPTPRTRVANRTVMTRMNMNNEQMLLARQPGVPLLLPLAICPTKDVVFHPCSFLFLRNFLRLTHARCTLSDGKHKIRGPWHYLSFFQRYNSRPLTLRAAQFGELNQGLVDTDLRSS